MMEGDLRDLAAFMAVARAGGLRVSGLSASTLGDRMRRLEARLGVRLLHRTTRSVAPTEAGERRLQRLGPALGEIDAALEAVGAPAPVLEPWWLRFPGPFHYDSGRRLPPPPLRAFVEFIRRPGRT